MTIKERFFKVVEKVKEIERKKKFDLFKQKFKRIHDRLPTDFEFTVFHYGFDYGQKYHKAVKKFKTDYFESEDKNKFLKEFE